VMSAWILTRTIHIGPRVCDFTPRSAFQAVNCPCHGPSTDESLPYPPHPCTYHAIFWGTSGGPQAGAATGLRLVVGSIHELCNRCGFWFPIRSGYGFQSADLRDGIVRGLGQILKFRLGGVFTLTCIFFFFFFFFFNLSLLSLVC